MSIREEVHERIKWTIDKYDYKRLPENVYKDNVNFFESNLPSHFGMPVDRMSPGFHLNSIRDNKLCSGFEEVKITGYGPFVRYTNEQRDGKLVVKPGEEWRLQHKNKPQILFQPDWNDNTDIILPRKSSGFKPGNFYVCANDTQPRYNQQDEIWID